MNDCTQFVRDLACFYNEPGKIGDQDNKKLLLLKDYINEHFKSEQFEKLFDLIVTNFKPFNDNPSFPLPVHIKEIWEKYNKEYTIEEQTEKTRRLLSETFGNPMQIEYTIPHDMVSNDTVSNSSNKEMLIDEYKLDSREMINKYGTKRCCEFWQMCGENWEKFIQGDFKRQKTNYEQGIKYD